MYEPAQRSDADRNLLFGILAVQMNFISRDALVAAMHAWVLDKKQPLGQILLEKRSLTAEQLQALDSLITQHLKAHGDDPECSIAEIGGSAIARSALEAFRDDDIESSLSMFEVSAGTTRENDGSSSHSEVGRYRKGRFHREGGLGEVYFAEDTELHREVALKEIKAKYADEPASRGRFVIEAEITGGLEHPGIVPVYGLGAYTNGRPYYAMRFIRGDSLKDAIERFHSAEKPGRALGERSLALRQLLRRFVDVCNAVAYAHNRGVLHRDLKPANIMLGPFGETLVVDWGLAKAGLEPMPHGEDATIDPVLRPASGSDRYATQVGSALGTLAYMSPEQAEGSHAQVGLASDIYSLGATLYAVLAGQAPYLGQDKDEVLAKVKRGEYQPLRSIKPATPPALEAICRKAMALEPRLRYASALDLAADVEHWLADEPVSAYHEPWTARASRWARRHRTAVVAVGVLLVTAIAGLSISTALVWSEQQRTAAEAVRAEANYELAERNYELARELNFTGIDLIESTQVDLASNPTFHEKRRDLLTAATGACRQFLKDNPNDPSLQTQAAKVFRYAANFHRLENDFAAAQPLYRDSIDLQRNLVGQFPDEPTRRDKLAATLRDSATVLANTGKLTKAAEVVGEAIKIVRQLKEEDPDSPAFRRSLATATLDLAAIEYSRGNFAESKTAARSAIEDFAKLIDLPAEQSHPYDPLLLAAATNRVAMIEREEGAIDEAGLSHRAAIKILDDLSAAQPHNVVRVDILHHLARCRLEQSRTRAMVAKSRDGAKRNIEACAAQWGGLAKNYSKIPLYRAALAEANMILGELREEDGAAAEALVNLETAQKIYEALVAEFPDMPSYRGDLGRTYLDLGRLARRQDLDERGRAWFTRAAEALSAAVGQSRDSAAFRRLLKDAQAALPK